MFLPTKFSNPFEVIVLANIYKNYKRTGKRPKFSYRPTILTNTTGKELCWAISDAIDQQEPWPVKKKLASNLCRYLCLPLKPDFESVEMAWVDSPLDLSKEYNALQVIEIIRETRWYKAKAPSAYIKIVFGYKNLKKELGEKSFFEKEIKLENFFLQPVRIISLDTNFLDYEKSIIENIRDESQAADVDSILNLIDLKRKLKKIKLHPLAIETLLAKKIHQIPSFRQAYKFKNLPESKYEAARRSWRRKSDLI